MEINHKIKFGDKFKLRNNFVWTFDRLGFISNNILIGHTENNKILCLFSNMKYRMDGVESIFDIISD